MNYKKISVFGFERFFTAICIAVSAINLIVSFLVAGYWYDKSTVIPYPVLLIISFILLEFILYAVINAMSEIGSQLDKKNVKIQKASQKKEDVTISIPETSKSAAAVSDKDVQDNAISVESEQEEPVSPKVTKDLSASEVPPVVSQASVERSESITKLLNLSAEEKRKKREKFIQGRKELMEAYIRGIMKPLLPEADIDALWLEYKQWIESSTYQPTSRLWKWKEIHMLTRFCVGMRISMGMFILTIITRVFAGYMICSTIVTFQMKVLLLIATTVILQSIMMNRFVLLRM